MRNLLHKCFKWQWLTCLTVGFCFSSCKDDDSSSMEYNPNEEVVLTSFHPNKGSLASPVVLEGGNFGKDKKIVKVFFNEKEASVVSAKGDKILVLAPRLPGEECIIKVQVGEREQVYKEIFDYVIQTNVTTLVGGKKEDKNIHPQKTVPLSEAQFRRSINRSIAIDEEKNIYFDVENQDGNWDCYIMNEEANQIKWLERAGYGAFSRPVIAYSPSRSACYKMQANSGNYDYWYYDKKIGLSKVQEGKIVWLNGVNPTKAPGMFTDWDDRQTYTMNPEDNKFYTRNFVGEILRFDPAISLGEVLNPYPNYAAGVEGVSNGVVFDVFDKNILYFSVEGGHCIYKYVLSTGTCTLLAGKEKEAKFMDGPLANARFNGPKQICMDSEGDLYVADKNNHCIRKITMKTGYVSTVAGIPQKSGYQNGTSEVALLNQPIGLVIDSEDIMYIGDSENAAIRRLAIE